MFVCFIIKNYKSEYKKYNEFHTIFCSKKYKIPPQAQQSSYNGLKFS